jgi:hypothetical protein
MKQYHRLSDNSSATIVWGSHTDSPSGTQPIYAIIFGPLTAHRYVGISFNNLNSFTRIILCGADHARITASISYLSAAVRQLIGSSPHPFPLQQDMDSNMTSMTHPNTTCPLGRESHLLPWVEQPRSAFALIFFFCAMIGAAMIKYIVISIIDRWRCRSPSSHCTNC